MKNDLEERRWLKHRSFRLMVAGLQHERVADIVACAAIVTWRTALACEVLSIIATD